MAQCPGGGLRTAPPLGVVLQDNLFSERFSFGRAIGGSLTPSDRPDMPGRTEPLTGDSADDVILAIPAEASVNVLATGNRKHLLSPANTGE